MSRLIAALLVLATGASAADLVRFQAPKTLSFEDLFTLASVDPPPPDVQSRLDALLNKPFISNEASFDGFRPLAPSVPGLGRVLRVAEWNINREYNEPMVYAFSDLHWFELTARENPELTPKRLAEAVNEARHLQGADVIVLNEVDHGVKRTGYHDVARDIAMRLHMNYTFVTEFVELTPLYLAFRKMDMPDQPRQKREAEQSGVNPKRYLGLEGSALLSRYPIRSVRIVHLPQEYDWYHGEIGAISDLEKAQNWAAERLFQERLTRQVRRGGRIMLIVDLDMGGSEHNLLTMICPHLEDYTDSEGRREQMDVVLKQTAPISSPVVMAGDFNTMGHNGAPITEKSLVKGYLLNYQFWLREALYEIFPVPGVHYALAAANYYKNFHDPTAMNIPILASNRSRPIFDDIHAFRFNDGGWFDWEGTEHNSYHHKGRTLSDSNNRVFKGFAPTFNFVRTYHGLVGSYKLDWIMVKEPGPFAPYYGRTLHALNYAPGYQISDHSPITIDLPLARVMMR